MAIEQFSPTTTAACDTGRCGSCRGVVFSLTDAHLTRCTHVCHLPDVWAERVAAFPPCDGDVELSDDDEAALEAVAELELERALEDAHFAGRWS